MPWQVQCVISTNMKGVDVHRQFCQNQNVLRFAAHSAHM